MKQRQCVPEGSCTTSERGGLPTFDDLDMTMRVNPVFSKGGVTFATQCDHTAFCSLLYPHLSRPPKPYRTASHSEMTTILLRRSLVWSCIVPQARPLPSSRGVHFDQKPEMPNHLGSTPRNSTTRRASMLDFVDYYSTLGVKRSDSLEQFKVSYYKLARKYHPDRPMYHDRLSKRW